MQLQFDQFLISSVSVLFHCDIYCCFVLRTLIVHFIPSRTVVFVLHFLMMIFEEMHSIFVGQIFFFSICYLLGLPLWGERNGYRLKVVQKKVVRRKLKRVPSGSWPRVQTDFTGSPFLGSSRTVDQHTQIQTHSNLNPCSTQFKPTS